MAQSNKTCSICQELGHSKFYCKKKPITPIKRTAIKLKAPVKKKIAKPKVKRVSRSQLVKKLDSVFSQYIRLKDATDSLEAQCVTCLISKPWKELQNGHFYTRGRYPTRWDEANCHVQCVACNVFLKGNYIKYTTYMIDRYGREAIDNLERKSLTTTKIPTPELEEKILYYTTKVKELLK